MVPAKRAQKKKERGKKIIPIPREDVAIKSSKAAPGALVVPFSAPGSGGEASKAPLVPEPYSQQEEAAQLTSGVSVVPLSNSGRLMGDAIRTAGKDPSGVFPAVESHSTKKRKADKGKAKVGEPSKRPRIEER